MSRNARKSQAAAPATLAKAPTGIYGLDDVTRGGLPQGRPTLLAGAAGSGKTLFGMEFLVRGATRYGEPGVFMSFEETEPELSRNFFSLGYDLDGLVAEKKLVLDYVSVERAEIEETGEYDLEALFIRLGYAVEQTKAKRVVLDTLEALFAGLTNEAVLRAEMRRLFRWLKDKGLTAVITAERGKEGQLTRYGIEEYVSDCVIVLDNRVVNELSTRRLRILKYRGSAHGTNEYPFTIDEQGITILPVSSMRLDQPAPTTKISSGVPQLDEMLGGGFYRGSSILVSGMAGTGKSTLGASFVNAACARGERALYFASEESPQQITRNMASIGLDLGQWVDRDLLRFRAVRPGMMGLETHLLQMQRLVTDFKPTVVVVDALTDFSDLGSLSEVKRMAERLVDFLKTKGVTGMFTALVSQASAEESGVGVSSTMDTWLHVANVQGNMERNRLLYLIKSRGEAHSNQVREFKITSQGVRLEQVYVGPGGALLGTARLEKEVEDRAAAAVRTADIARRKQEIDEKRKLLEARIAAMRAEFAAEEGEMAGGLAREERAEEEAASETQARAARRGPQKEKRRAR